MQVLINIDSKINKINLAYTKKPSFHIKQTDVKFEEIDKSYLKIFKIVIAGFSI